MQIQFTLVCNGYLEPGPFEVSKHPKKGKFGHLQQCYYDQLHKKYAKVALKMAKDILKFAKVAKFR